MSAAEWWVTAKGRLRTTILLHDGDEVPLARLEPRRTRTSDRCVATDRWDRRWTTEAFGLHIATEHDGATWARAEDDVLRVEDRRFGWQVRHDGSRRATVTDVDDRSLLEIGTRGCGSGEWARIRVHEDLPRPLPVVLTALLPLLAYDARVGEGGVGGGAGPGG